jgi:hypothetical protein
VAERPWTRRADRVRPEERAAAPIGAVVVGGVELEVRVGAPDRGAVPPRAAFIRQRLPFECWSPAALIAAGLVVLVGSTR